LAKQEALEFINFNDTSFVDIMDVKQVKDIYRRIHLGLEEVRSETRFSSKRHKAFNEMVENSSYSNYQMVIFESVAFILLVVAHGLYMRRLVQPKNIV
jgi:hypothetical protein